MRVIVEPGFAAEYFASRQELDLEAGNLFQLVAKLDEIGPGFGDIAEVRTIFAVDGTVVTDWSAPLSAASEVYVIPRIGGGEGPLEWRVLSPFGVELLHDLSQPFSPAGEEHFRHLLNQHGLILARGQSLSMERQREICGLIGPILQREGEDGYMSNEGGGPSASALAWHADAAYTEEPFDALSLHALDVVDDASSTLFVSAEQAFDDLPGDLRSRLAGREQEMISPHYTMIDRRTCDRRDPEAQKRGILPAIYTNPHNGRQCVWTSELQTARLLGMDWEESRDLLHAVYDRLYAPERVLEHRWRKGDIVIWDNIALQHARGELGGVGKRLLQRAIVGTSGVAPHIAQA